MREFEVYHFVNGTGTKMENVIDVRVTRTLNAKSNSAEIIVDNLASRSLASGAVKYKPDDVVKIYAAENNVNIATTSHLLGVFNILDIDIQPDNKTIKLKCGDKTYTMLSKIFVGDLNDNVNDIVGLIVQRVNQTGSTATPITTHIATTRSDTTAFPSIQFASAYKTAYDCIAELSQPETTGDTRSYLFWFDENGEFWWQYPGLTPVGSFTYGVDPVVTMTMSKAEAESVAMIIYDAGLDKNDTAILGFYVDENAGTIKNRIKYQPMTDISKLLKRKFQNDGTYTAMANSTFVAYCENGALARARTIIAKVGAGLWESIATINGGNYTPGDLYTVAAPAFGFPSTNLRLDRVVHTMNKNGWSTQLTLKEDPAAVE